MLKNNKGITLISLTSYVIVLMIVIALMSGFVGYFNKNMKNIAAVEESDEQFTRFLEYITKDIKKEDITFIKTGTSDDVNYVIIKFENEIEHQYLYANNAIYYIDKKNEKKINLSDNVSSCNFTYDKDKKTLSFNIMINNKQYSKILIVEYI